MTAATAQADAEPRVSARFGDGVGVEQSRQVMCGVGDQPGGRAGRRGDLDALMSFVTDDCVYSASVGPEPGTTYVGRSAVR